MTNETNRSSSFTSLTAKNRLYYPILVSWLHSKVINLKKLKTRGLVVEDDNRFLALSEEGGALAEAIIQRRNILIGYFTKVLGVNPKQAAIDACKTEHLLSGETTKKMSEHLR